MPEITVRNTELCTAMRTTERVEPSEINHVRTIGAFGFHGSCILLRLWRLVRVISGFIVGYQIDLCRYGLWDYNRRPNVQGFEKARGHTSIQSCDWGRDSVLCMELIRADDVMAEAPPMYVSAYGNTLRNIAFPRLSLAQEQVVLEDNSGCGPRALFHSGRFDRGRAICFISGTKTTIPDYLRRCRSTGNA